MKSTVAEPIIDKSFLEKLERLALHWQRSFQGLVGGHNRSRMPGPGQEFLDHRHYYQGDDPRAVNWRVYMRLEKLFLKMFEVEPRVPVRLLLDVSQSMATGKEPKFDYARRLTAALSYVGLVGLEAITIQSFSNQLGDRYLCCGGRHSFAPAVDYLATLSPGGRTNFIEVVRQFISASTQRGLLIILSDFLDDDDCIRPLQYLADFGHELLLVHLWADEDRTPPWEGELELTDAETGDQLALPVGPQVRQAYTAAFDDWARSLRETAQRGGGRYVGIPTSMPVEEAIFGPLVRSRGVE